MNFITHAVLYFRLEAYDRNFNFGYDHIAVADDYCMSTPDATTHRDINTSESCYGMYFGIFPSQF